MRRYATSGELEEWKTRALSRALKRGVLRVFHNKGNWFGFNTGETTFALEPQSNRKAYDFKFNTKNPILLQFRVKSIAELKRITKMLESKHVHIKQRLLKKSYGTITTIIDPDNNVIEFLVKTN